MTGIAAKELRGDLTFGALVEGLDWHHLEDKAVRRQITDIFLERGMILFRGG